MNGWDLDQARACFTEYELKSTWDRVVPLLRDGTLGPPAPGSSDPAAAEELGATPAPATEPVLTEVGVALHPRAFRPAPELTRLEDGAGAAPVIAQWLEAAADHPVAMVAASEGLAGRSPLVG